MQNPNPSKKAWNPLLVILGLSGAFFLVFVLFSTLFFLRGANGGRNGPGWLGGKAVGLIEMNGVILDSKRTVRQLEHFQEDPSIRSIVLRLNSPGGSVAPSQEIYEAVKASKKPIVVSMGSVAASGAFYIAMGAKKVFANPGTITGSIGVIMEFANLEKLYDWAKIQRYAIKTGRFKDAGADYRALEPDERALLQGMVDNVLGQFKAAVAEGRKLAPSEVDRVADGRIFSGEQAKKLKLVDELGTLDAAIAEAARLAKISGKPQVVVPDFPRRRLLDLLMGSGAGEDGDLEESRSPLKRLVGQLGREFGLGATGAGLRSLELPPGMYWLWEGAR